MDFVAKATFEVLDCFSAMPYDAQGFATAIGVRQSKSLSDAPSVHWGVSNPDKSACCCIMSVIKNVRKWRVR